MIQNYDFESRDRIEKKLKKEAIERGGKESQWLAYAVDTFVEERTKGITVEGGRETFITETK
jgi:translation elongation factor EF-1alpha